MLWCCGRLLCSDKALASPWIWLHHSGSKTAYGNHQQSIVLICRPNRVPSKEGVQCAASLKEDGMRLVFCFHSYKSNTHYLFISPGVYSCFGEPSLPIKIKSLGCMKHPRLFIGRNGAVGERLPLVSFRFI
ncbi:MAG: hypothetical protein DBY25_03370 [Clostridiales bacterium]|nr:MAG: hypothetical protein DBY25_03370 [Clostridiales bacterium]